jgi:hypothetical protein
MVVHELLLCKLRNAQNYSVRAGRLVGSYLGERAQFVRSVGAMTCGVPDLFFVRSCLYHILTTSTRVIRYCRFHIYADDLQIYYYCAVSDFQRCIDELNLDLQLVHE